MEPGSYAAAADGAKDLEGLLGAGGGRSLLAHSPLMPAVNYAPLDLPGSSEPPKQCHPCPGAPQGASPAPVPYGYFGGGYYSCRLARGSLKPCAPAAAAALAAYPAEPPAAAAEFAFYPGYPAPYQPVASYLDVSVVQTLGAPGEPRHDALLPVDSYQPWALPGGWNGQMCCQGEQNPPPPGSFWKTAFAGTARPDPGPWAPSLGWQSPLALAGEGAGGLGLRRGSWVSLLGCWDSEGGSRECESLGGGPPRSG